MKKTKFMVGFVAVALAFATMGCDDGLSLSNEDDRALAVQVMTEVPGTYKLSEGGGLLPLARATEASGLTIAFHVDTALSDSDQYILFGDAADTVGLRNGYLGPWGTYEINDAAWPKGDVGVWKNKCAADSFYTVVFNSTEGIVVYMNGEKIGVWELGGDIDEKVKSFSAAIYSALSTGKLKLIPGGDGIADPTLSKVWYGPAISASEVSELYAKNADVPDAPELRTMTEVPGTYKLSDGGGLLPAAKATEVGGLTIAFHVDTALSDSDQYVLFGDAADTVGLRNGYLGPWNDTWGMNDGAWPGANGAFGAWRDACSANSFYTVVFNSTDGIVVYMNGDKIGAWAQGGGVKAFSAAIYSALSTGKLKLIPRAGEGVTANPTLSKVRYGPAIPANEVSELYKKAMNK